MTMQFPVDVNEYERAGSNERYIIPDNTYTLEVMEVTPDGTSKNGDPKINFKLGLVEFLNNPDWPYNRWLYHSIFLIPMGKKGHGIALHFLKVLGAVPDEQGIINIEPSEFIGRRFSAFVYSEKDAQGILRQRINHIEPLPEVDTEEVPF